MRSFLYAIGILFLALSTIAPAQRTRHPSNAVTAQAREQATSGAVIDNSTTEMEHRISEAENRLASIDTSNAHLQTTLSLLGIGFGGLITTIVIFFAIRTERSSATAASSAARDEIRKSREIIDSQVEDVRNMRVKLEGIAGEIAAHKNKALEDVQEIQNIKDNLSIDYQAPSSNVDDETVSGDNKNDRNIEDQCKKLVKTIGEEIESGNFDKAIELSFELKSCSESPYYRLYAIFFRAYAYGELGLSKLATDTYTAALASVEPGNDAELEGALARARYNRASQTNKMGDRDLAIARYTEIIDQYYSEENDKIIGPAIRALKSRARIHAAKGDDELARKDYKEIVTKFGENPHRDAKKAVKEAWEFLGVPEAKNVTE